MVVSRQPAESSTPRRTLEDLLATENAYEDDGIWRAGVGKVYRALVDGARLKKRMPLRLVVRYICSCSLLSSPLQVSLLMANDRSGFSWQDGSAMGHGLEEPS